MKLLNTTLSVLIVLVITLQSCGLTGNKASAGAGQPPVQSDQRAYFNDIQLDTNLILVSLTNYLQPFTTTWPYAGTENFTGQVLYSNPEAFLRVPAARALRAVQEDLRLRGLGIMLFDAYRPYRVTKKMWEIVPDERYAANPAKGSGHNRGIAVDLTLTDLATGRPLKMPTAFDDFSEKAHHDYPHPDAEVVKNRALLKATMEKHGFKALDTEWWHYFLPDAGKYPLMDFDFDQARALASHKY